MIVIGLTGSIGMGKSTTASLFAETGARVHDSDAAVHELYNGAGAAIIEAEFPGVTSGGKVDRRKLADLVLGDPAALGRLEKIVHPHVGKARADFVAESRREGCRMVVLDIPLLFEIGGGSEVDVIVVASAPADVQRARVLARPGMTEEKFETIVQKQTPDPEKRGRAHFVVETHRGIEFARRRVESIVRCLGNFQIEEFGESR